MTNKASSSSVVDGWNGLLDSMNSQMSPEQLAKAVRRLFWNVHESNPHVAQILLREISVDWDERYGWLGGTDPD